jgi:hypothetical protein
MRRQLLLSLTGDLLVGVFATERREGDCRRSVAVPPTVGSFYHRRPLPPFRAAIADDWALDFSARFQMALGGRKCSNFEYCGLPSSVGIDVDSMEAPEGTN